MIWPIGSRVPCGVTTTDPKPGAPAGGGAAPSRPASRTGSRAGKGGPSSRRPDCWRPCWSCSIWLAMARIWVSSTSMRADSLAPLLPPSRGAPPPPPPRASDLSVPTSTCMSTSCSSSCSTRWRSWASPVVALGAGSLRAPPWSGRGAAECPVRGAGACVRIHAGVAGAASRTAGSAAVGAAARCISVIATAPQIHTLDDRTGTSRSLLQAASGRSRFALRLPARSFAPSAAIIARARLPVSAPNRRGTR